MELLKSELNLERTEETIKYNTIKAYFDILEAKQNVNIEQESVNNYESHLTDVRNLYAAGSIPNQMYFVQKLLIKCATILDYSTK